jgi:hypothetical protein
MARFLIKRICGQSDSVQQVGIKFFGMTHDPTNKLKEEKRTPCGVIGWQQLWYKFLFEFSHD